MFKIIIASIIIIPCAAIAAPLNDYTFKSPAFNGIGYSQHILTIENQESTRRKAVEDKMAAALQQRANEAKNTNLNKFMNNLESRIYAQISQNLATAMFADGATNSGTLNFEGNTIFWTKAGAEIHLIVTDTVGNSTEVVVPLGQFTF